MITFARRPPLNRSNPSGELERLASARCGVEAEARTWILQCFWAWTNSEERPGAFDEASVEFHRLFGAVLQGNIPEVRAA
jgi:hypothetical protein